MSITYKTTKTEGVYSVSIPAAKEGYRQIVGYVVKCFGEIGGSGNDPIYGDYWRFTRQGIESVGGWPTRQRAAEALVNGWPIDQYTLAD